MPTMIMEIKPIVLVQYEFEKWQKNKIKVLSLDVSDNQDTDPRKKNIEFWIDDWSTSVLFLIQSLMEEIEHAVAQN